MTYEHDICGCYKYVGIPLSYDDAVIECASMNGELAKIDRGIIQLKMEHLIDYLSMQFTFLLLYISFTLVHHQIMWNYIFNMLDVALSLPEMIF